MLDKATIEAFIVPHLSKAKRGMATKVSNSQIVEAILHRLKTGCQWRELPTRQFFGATPYSWQAVYRHFARWASDGSWQHLWVNLMRTHRRHLRLSSLQLDGSQTPAKKGGECVGYQGRKKARTTNLIFLCDDQGQMLACGQPASGEHHDSYRIEQVFSELLNLLKQAGLATEGLFLNADAGFDTQALRQVCWRENIQANLASNPRKAAEAPAEAAYFDEVLYRRRGVIEGANAWLDSCKALLVRFETLAAHWLALHWMAFSFQFIRKIQLQDKP